ncbi:hypothetical protein F3Y22_tig00000778pilonHSYRG00358 [Hibiscus syriacus]|uniref:ubiquitinyl hydrolase 1 n=1 Tax=Hibiscus syriacus TaxID=106335 RepID=A0A6A3D4P7_HIBSY|nr:hypothetical protein F3Y22_tig00000778pilonHSYRG00358 [Hibiscus syriacus]
MLSVSVKWQKELLKAVEVDTSQPPYVFKCQLYDLTGVPPERQKIMVKGGLLKDEDDWSTVGLKQGQKLMMMGTADEVVKAPEKGPVFMEDLPVEEQVVSLVYNSCCPGKYGSEVALPHINRISMDLPILLLTHGYKFANCYYSKKRDWLMLRNYVTNLPLKRQFPRIYALSTNKWGMISEFGEYEDEVWVWNIQLRRMLCDWELDQWIAFMSLIDKSSLSRCVDDFLGWSGKGDGIFSVKSCRLSLQDRSEGSFVWKKWVWDGLAPPRVQTLIWQICHQKVAVRVELKRRGLQISDVLCPMCHDQDETVAHLFLTCPIASELWSKFLRLWNISTVMPQDPSSILCSWSNLRNNSLIWRFIPAVIFWSIWKARNEVVFENGICDSTVLFFITRFRLAKWFLAKYPGVRILTDLLVGDPTRADLLPSNSSSKKISCWTPPPSDMFKLNVDGAVTGDGMQGGIGGVLRDSGSCTLANFSSAVGPGPPILSELKAIKKGLLFFFSSDLANKGRLILESDNKYAVDWILKRSPSPTIFSELVEEIGVLVSTKGVVLRWVSRSCNMEADRLAKQGIG